MKPSDFTKPEDLTAMTSQVKRIALDRLEHRARKSLSGFSRIEIELSVDWAWDHFNLEFSARPWSHAKRKTGEFRNVPRTWWDHWKIESCPLWLRGVFSTPNTNRIEIAITYTSVCPHAALDITTQEPHLEWLMQNSKELRS